MLEKLRTPRWIALAVLVAVIVSGFLSLGNWQMRRHRERATENQVLAGRVAADPIPLAELVTGAGGDLDSLEYRRTTVVGRYLSEPQALVRGHAHRGSPGYHVLTLLELEDGVLLVVNRGWIPLGSGDTPEPPAPPGESVELEGWVRLTQVKTGVGPVDPEAWADVVVRVDLERLKRVTGLDLAPVWLQAVEDEPGVLEGLGAPDPDDPGPHLDYAIQWYSFATISVVGFFALLRRKPRI